MVSALCSHHELVAVDTLLTLGAKLVSWRRSCDQTLASLGELSQNLLRKIKGFHKRDNTIGADVVGSNCIACLAHLAILHEGVCRADFASTSAMYKPCDSALQSLGELTSELCFDEYSYLDLLLGVRPSLFYFTMAMIKTGDWDRSLGRNRYRSSTSG